MGVSPDGQWGEVWPDELAFAAAKAVAAALLACVFAWCIWSRQTVLGLLGICISALMLLSPVVHPWYLLWVLPFAALSAGGQRAALSRPFFVWSLLIWLAYVPRAQYLETGEWHTEDWIVWLEYLPVWASLIWSGAVHLAKRQEGTSSKMPSAQQ